MNSPSFWLQESSKIIFPKLNESLETDVVIVGAGITGLSTAYQLLQRGIQPVILEAQGGVAEGDSGFTSGHLTALLDSDYSELQTLYGEEAVRLIVQKNFEAIDDIEMASQKFQCDFERIHGFLFTDDVEESHDLEKQFYLLDSLGFEGIRLVKKAPMSTYRTGPALLLPRQARFHPVHYLEQMALSIVKQGGKIFTDCRVIKKDQNKILTENGFEIHAKHFLFATHAPLFTALTDLKRVGFRTYVMGFKVPKGILENALYWDTEQPYHYLRLQPLTKNEDLLILGGEDHRTGEINQESSEPYLNLELWAKKHFGHQISAHWRWSGQVFESADGLPYIGRVSEKDPHFYVSTGYAGNGLTYGTLAAKLLSDLILDQSNPLETLFSPSRKNVKTLQKFAAESFHHAGAYVEKIASGLPAFEKHPLKNGEGGVFQKGRDKIAAFRDSVGNLHAFSAECTHLGCLVEWNKADKTFDCPCHGSRFTAQGEVFQAPATHGLKKIETEKKAA